MSPVHAMLPYLFEKEAVLYRTDNRESVLQGQGPGQGQGGASATQRIVSPSRQGVRTSETFVKPHPTENRLFDAKVYMLTSGFTASAAEAFAVALKATRRATIVGENTAGAGHFAPAGQRVNDNFEAFVPVGKAYDPRTGKGWERTGVAPDIKVPAEKALVEALVRSGVSRKEAEKLSASVHPQGPMKKPTQAS